MNSLLVERVLDVEEQDAQALGLVAGHAEAQIIDQGVPAGEHRPVHHLGAGQALGRVRHRFERHRARLADAVHPLQLTRPGAQHVGERAEALQQRVGDRLGVTPRDRMEQEQLQHLVIGEGARPAVEEPFSQAASVAAMDRFVRHPLPWRRSGAYSQPKK